jgi:hypothetical protein
VRREGQAGDAAAFRREWNFALLLVLVVAGVLFAASHAAAGAIALGLGAAALVARWNAMRKANRGFYGQDKRAAK